MSYDPSPRPVDDSDKAFPQYDYTTLARQMLVTLAKSIEADDNLRADRDRLAALNAELVGALDRVAGNYVETLAGNPVRDADECIERARALIAKARDGKG